MADATPKPLELFTPATPAEPDPLDVAAATLAQVPGNVANALISGVQTIAANAQQYGLAAILARYPQAKSDAFRAMLVSARTFWEASGPLPWPDIPEDAPAPAAQS